MGEWVDFKKVKAAVTMEMVLNHYGIKGLSKHSDELRGACPIHKGSKGSKDFTVNLQKNAFKCFSSKCRAKGNVLDFVAGMQGCDIRTAAVKLTEWFKIGDTESAPSEELASSAPDVSRGVYRDLSGDLFEVIATALTGENSEQLVVYRELSGEYRFRVAPPENFGETDCRFTLLKAL